MQIQAVILKVLKNNVFLPGKSKIYKNLFNRQKHKKIIVLWF